MNLMDLFIKIGVDDQATNKIEKISSAAKVGIAAIGVASAGVAAFAKESLDQYAEYEQLVGGVDTLFKEASQKVQRYAAEAYKTAGMSANDYMANATAFSASLIGSLGGDTEAAAEYANRAMVSMSDNANKMGTDIDSIVQTYQSLARGNFAMLDNLKLGYGGTKAELERLIKDASTYTDVQKEMGVTVDASSTSFDNIVNAIAVVQGHLGIAGATSAEAATTIEGSLNSMKASWENLVTGIGNENANLDTLIDNFVNNIAIAAENIVPRITNILSGMGQAIQKIAPIFSEQIPAFVTSVVPAIISAGAQLLTGLITGIITALPELAAAVPEIVNSIVYSISKNLPAILDSGKQILGMLTNGILEGIPTMLEYAPNIITALFNFLAENGPTFIESGFNFIMNLISGIINAIPEMVARLPDVITSITTFFTANFPVILLKGGELLGQLIMGILGAIPEIAVKLPAVITAIEEAFKAGKDVLKDAGKRLLEGLWNGISEKVSWLKEKVAGFVNTIKGWFTGKDGFDEHSPSKWSHGVASYLMDGLAFGITDNLKKVRSAWVDTMNLFDNVSVPNTYYSLAYNKTGTTEQQSSGIVINQYIQSIPQTPVELAAATQAYFEQARWAF